MNQRNILSLPDQDLKRLEIIGAIIVCILAPVFHFLFEWSGDNTFVGIFAAVNESVWEHTKIVYFPFLFYSIAEYFILRDVYKRQPYHGGQAYPANCCDEDTRLFYP